MLVSATRRRVACFALFGAVMGLIPAPAPARAATGTALSGFTSLGHVLVAGGRVFVSPGSGGDHVAELGLDDAVRGSLTGLSGPNGLAAANGLLYVAETDASRIATFDLSSDPPTAGPTIDVSSVGAPVDLAVAGGKLWFTTQATCGVTVGKLGSVDLDGTNPADQTPVGPPGWTDCPALEWSAFTPNLLFLHPGATSTSTVLSGYDVSGGSPVAVVSGDLGATYQDGPVAILPSGTRVAAATSAGVGTFSIATFASVKPTYPVGTSPVVLASSAADGGLLLAGAGSKLTRWSVGDAASSSTTTFPATAGAVWADGLAVDGTGKRLFVALGSPTKVAIAEVLPAQRSTSLTLSVSATRVGPGTTVKATAHLTGGGRGAIVTIRAMKVGGIAKTLKSAKVSAKGNLTAAFTPTQNTFVWATFAGDPSWASATSTRIEVRLRPRVSVKLPKTSQTSGAYRIYHPVACLVTHYGYQGCLPITTTVAPNAAGQPATLVLQAYKHGSWRTMDRRKVSLSSKSRAVLVLGSSAKDGYRIGTKQRFQAIFPKSALHLDSSSRWAYLEVVPFPRPRTRAPIAAASSRIDPR